jgi:hypothetical protein
MRIDGGRRRASIRIVLDIGCPSFYALSRGEGKREGPTKLFLYSNPLGMAEMGTKLIRWLF